MAMLFYGCGCNSQPHPYLCREQAIWQCDECLALYQIIDGDWKIICDAAGVAEAFDRAQLFR